MPLEKRGVKPVIKINVIRVSPEALFPSRAYDSDAGWDIYSLDSGVVFPGETRPIDTGLVIYPEDPDWCIKIEPRSGNARKHSVSLLCGVVDPGYTGRIQVVAHNHGGQTFYYRRGQAIAQFLILPRPKVTLQELPPEAIKSHDGRGAAGFGSSDKGVESNVDSN